eukprot:TRINITY_DN6212_c1_g1_i1.p1 TRINITY_DN6212_c1_g1~~TRINITY_DN6212_c1_g1_i1.p1  ORF type:complete len:491 (-),score=70.59 TRINITY_DN6212_c1_g1_i1:9-1481(-)
MKENMMISLCIPSNLCSSSSRLGIPSLNRVLSRAHSSLPPSFRCNAKTLCPLIKYGGLTGLRTVSSQTSSLKQALSFFNFKRSFCAHTNAKDYDHSKQQNSQNEDEVELTDEERERRKKIIGTWLLICCGLVVIVVVVGAITRLTESGLSIVEWKPISGIVPPLNEEEWQKLFEDYKKTPEFIKVHSHMQLEDFKYIFFWEYIHRIGGRTVGLAYLLPFLTFYYKKWLVGPEAALFAGMFGLIGFQGLVGWLMVKSGLEEPDPETNQAPRVSHLRLAAHLGTAFTLYSCLLYTALKCFEPEKKPRLSEITGRQFIHLQRGALGLLALTFTTAVSGALVAGLRAGRIYNEFPFMGGWFWPEEVLRMEPKWKNSLYNESTVQFQHRALATTTLTSVTLFYSWAIRKVPTSCKRPLNFLLGISYTQFILGISTLLSFVSLPVAVAHQAGALALLSSSLWFLARTRNLQFVRRSTTLPMEKFRAIQEQTKKKLS